MEYKVLRPVVTVADVVRADGRLSAEGLNQVGTVEHTTPVGRGVGYVLRWVPYAVFAVVVFLVLVGADCGLGVSLAGGLVVGVYGLLRIEAQEQHDNPYALERYRLDAVNEAIEASLKYDHELKLLAVQMAMQTYQGGDYGTITISGYVGATGGAAGAKQLPTPTDEGGGHDCATR